MKRQALCAILAILLLLSVIPTKASAQDIKATDNIIVLSDGSYIEITIEEISARATNSKSGSKTYTYKTNSGEVVWVARLSAAFNYNGSTSTACYGSCTVTISNNNWYEVSNSTSCSGNTATTQLTMGRKFLGITVEKPDFTITLSCDKNGNLS